MRVTRTVGMLCCLLVATAAVGQGVGDCNGNGIPDADEIASAPWIDCDSNGVIDACELAARDCNSNGVIDACDFESGYSLDTNGNGVPDECEIPSGVHQLLDNNGVPIAGAALTAQWSGWGTGNFVFRVRTPEAQTTFEREGATWVRAWGDPHLVWIKTTAQAEELAQLEESEFLQQHHVALQMLQDFRAQLAIWSSVTNWKEEVREQSLQAMSELRVLVARPVADPETGEQSVQEELYPLLDFLEQMTQMTTEQLRASHEASMGLLAQSKAQRGPSTGTAILDQVACTIGDLQLNDAMAEIGLSASVGIPTGVHTLVTRDVSIAGLELGKNASVVLAPNVRMLAVPSEPTPLLVDGLAVVPRGSLLVAGAQCRGTGTVLVEGGALLLGGDGNHAGLSDCELMLIDGRVHPIRVDRGHSDETEAEHVGATVNRFVWAGGTIGDFNLLQDQEGRWEIAQGSRKLLAGATITAKGRIAMERESFVEIDPRDENAPSLALNRGAVLELGPNAQIKRSAFAVGPVTIDNAGTISIAGDDPAPARLSQVRVINRGTVQVSGSECLLDGALVALPESTLLVESGRAVVSGQSNWAGGGVQLKTGGSVLLESGTHTIANKERDARDVLLAIAGAAAENDHLTVRSRVVVDAPAGGRVSLAGASLVLGQAGSWNVPYECSVTLDAARDGIVRVDGGSFDVNGACQVSGKMTWVSGAIAGSGSFRHEGGKLVIEGDGGHRVMVPEFNMAGQMELRDGASLVLESPVDDPMEFVVDAGGEVQLSSGTAIRGSAYTWGQSHLRNNGIIRVTGDASAEIERHVTLQNLGELAIESGSMTIGLLESAHDSTMRVAMNLGKGSVPLAIQDGRVDGTLEVSVTGAWPDGVGDRIAVAWLGNAEGRFGEMRLRLPPDIASQMSLIQHENLIELVRNVGP